VLQALYTLSDEQAEYQLRDRLSFMRFAGLSLHDAVPDAKTIWLYREQLTRAGALSRVFARFDAMVAERGYLAMGGQIVDATVVEARRPRLTKEEKAHLRDGGTPEGVKVCTSSDRVDLAWRVWPLAASGSAGSRLSGGLGHAASPICCFSQAM
jgi:IS5 family transposase